MTVAAAELVHQVTLSQQGEHMRMELYGVAGGGSEARLMRAELQRILEMLHAEVGKAAWAAAPAIGAPPTPAGEEAAPKPARH
jgi:1,6-anhydro-N-acetylmuramate kinase